VEKVELLLDEIIASASAEVVPFAQEVRRIHSHD
jgi:hypothetical protein